MKLAATLTLEEAGRRRWDCVVIGAGPAGSMAARETARQGASVLLVEKAEFPRYKVCGCCLNPRSLQLLADVGLSRLAHDAEGIPLHRLRLATSGRSADLRIPTGLALSRSSFDTKLVEAAIDAGASFLPNTSAILEADVASPDSRSIELKSAGASRRIESRTVVAATGLGGRFRQGRSEEEVAIDPNSRIGAGTIADTTFGYPAGVIHMACGKAGYVGLVQIEGNRLDIAAALDAQAVRSAGGIGPVAADIVARSGLPPIADLEHLAWKGTPFLKRRALHLAENRLFLIGDAAGYVEPFTGEGMAWALVAGRAVAPLVIEGRRDWNGSLVTEWNRIYRSEVAKRQVTCRLSATVLRSPFVTRAAVRLLSVLPVLATPVLRGMYRR